MTFNFPNLPRSATAVSVNVQLLGDYNGSSEFADITIDGVAPAGSPQNPRAAQCNSRALGADGSSATFSVASSVTDDNAVTVVVANSPNVNASTCNNTPRSNQVRVNLSYTGLPDLRFQALTAPVGGGSVIVGQPFDLQMTVINSGEQNLTANHRFHVYSCPAASPTGCMLVDDFNVTQNLGVRRSTTHTRTLILPTATPLGTGYIRVVADADDTVSEGFETNNEAYSAITVAAPTTPDLRVLTATVPVGATSIPFNGQATVDFSVINQGLGFNQPCVVQFYQCSTAGPGSCVQVATLVLRDSFSQGQVRRYSPTFNLTSPLTSASRTDYLRIHLDSNDRLNEGSTGEANNNSYHAFTYTNPSQPDLYVGASEAPIATRYVAGGNQVAVDYTVTNQGTSLSAPFTVALFYCPDANATGCTHGRTRTITDWFPRSQQRSYTDTLGVPNGIVAADGYVRIRLDSGNAVPEVDEGNNERYHPSQVRQPDLFVSTSTTPSAPSAVAPGQPISFAFRIENDASAGAVTDEFSTQHYYCETEDATACISLGRPTTITDDFASGHSREYVQTSPLPPNATVGTRYIRTSVDGPRDQIAESDETNNDYYQAIIVACATGFAGASCDACDTDYYGFPACNYCLASTTCNGNGSCDGSGVCACGAGFAGPACEYSDAIDCSGGGVAQFDGSCACAAGYAGPLCEYSDEMTCGGSGVAQDDGSCVCNSGYAGAACQYADATTCSGGGAAQDDGSCVCNPGFAGVACQYSDAMTCNGNGEAQDDGACICSPNAAGPACEFSDEADCSGHGMVQDDGTCACAVGYAGEACQFSDIETCREGGMARADGTCACADGYAGEACQYSATETCNEHGQPQSDGTCECADGYLGDACQYSDSGSCSGAGVAQADGTCSCDDGFTGGTCKQLVPSSCHCTSPSYGPKWSSALTLFALVLLGGRKRRRSMRTS